MRKRHITPPLLPFHTPSLLMAGLMLCLLSLPRILPAQTPKTLVEGTVTDAKSGAPIPYARIQLIGTQTGTITDTSGYYRLETYRAGDSIKASSIGYLANTVPVRSGESQQIDISLYPWNYSLSAVEITPDDREDPAYPIIRQIIAHKARNNPAEWEAFQFEVYNKIKLGLYGVDPEGRLKGGLRSFQFIMDYVDTTEEQPFLPVFITESLSDFYYRKKPESIKEHIRATKVSGLKNESVSRLLGNVYQRVNLYNDNVILFNRTFVSPVSDNCFRYYRFYLMDSTEVNGRKRYNIQFRPRRKQELTFYGQLWVEDSLFALCDIEVNMAEDANVNFINAFRFSHHFEEVGPGQFFPVMEKLRVEAQLFIPSEGRNQLFLAEKEASFRDIVINRPREAAFYQSPQLTSIEPDANDKTEDYWRTSRHDPLSVREQNVYVMVDSVKQVPLFRLVKTLAYGYADLGLFELGPFFSLYSYNPVEGHRFRMGGRTANAFSNMTEIHLYGAYGTRDQQFKYGALVRQFITKQPRRLLTLSLRDDVEQLGTTDNLLFRSGNLLNTLFTSGPRDRLNRVTEYRFNYEREWVEGISNQLRVSRRTLRPLGALTYEQVDPDGNLQPVEALTTFELTFHTHFAWKEKFLYGEFERISLGTRYPMIDLVYSKGIEGVWGGEYDYHRLLLNIRHRVRVPRAGFLTYELQGGKYWGTLPYPLLEIHSGNQTLFYDARAFNSMNFLEFVSDRYASASLSWQLEGLLFNKIPLLRRLMLREVIGAKAVIGSMREENRRELELPAFMYTLDKPFAEVSFGIENILRVIRVDGIWRLTHLENPEARRFVVRMGFNFTF